jgi:hypothetical protein
MSVEGRINVDVLFHDTDGTNAINVVTLAKSDGYSSGKVAIVTGVCGMTPTYLAVQPTSYRGPDGQYVSFSTVDRIAFSSEYKCRLNNEEEYGETLITGNGAVSVTDISTFSDSLNVQKIFDINEPSTSSYTLVIYGT